MDMRTIDMTGRLDALAPLVPADEVPTDRPVVILDVDGVLNAYDYGLEPSPWQPVVESNPEPYAIDREALIRLPYRASGAYGHVATREYPIRWSTELAGDLARLADDGRVTLLWLTSWNAEAGLLAEGLLWPGRPSPVIGYMDATGEDGRCSYASKRLVMKAVCDAMGQARPDDPMPVVAFDDDMPWDATTWGGGVEFPRFFHGIGTNPAHGVTRSQLRVVAGIVDETSQNGSDDGDGQGNDVE